jgi:solute carrier family 25 (mitochondrial phosphate transporter), member 3
VSFDVFAGLFYALFDQYGDNIVWLTPHKKLIVSISAAFVASLFACIFSQPGDMILTETYRRVDPGKQLSFPQVVDKIYSSGGIANFFTGTGARIVHVGLIITR